jgi:hypothetical protein
MRIILFITAISVFTSCQNNQTNVSDVNEVSILKYSNQDFGSLSLILPSTWHRIPDDSFPHSPDMTARYWIQTSTGDTMFLMQGFSAWDLSQENPENYIRKQDTLFGKYAIKFNSKTGNNACTGVFVDSVGEIKPVGYYGFTAYARGFTVASIDTFWKVVQTIKLHSFK